MGVLHVMCTRARAKLYCSDNVMYTADPEIATPPLNGTILPGVTRLSLLELGATWVSGWVREGEREGGRVRERVRERRG